MNSEIETPRLRTGELKSTDEQTDIKRDGAQAQRRKVRPQSKKAGVLRVFLQRGEQGLDCFQAVTLARDFVLRTTVSELKRYDGIEFNKERKTFKNAGGTTTDYVKYSLTAEGVTKARELLGLA